MKPCALRIRSGIQAGFTTQTAQESILTAPVLTISNSATSKVRRSSFGYSRRQRLLNNVKARLRTMKDPLSVLREAVYPKEKVLTRNRFWELDASRGLAVGMMILQHFIKACLIVVNTTLGKAAIGFWFLAKNWLMLAGVSAYALTAFSSTRFPRLSKSINVPSSLKTVIAGMELGLLAVIIFWLATSSSGAAGFMLVMGITMSIRYERSKKRLGEISIFPEFLKRGLELLACAAVITGISYLISPEKMVTFGILHLLGVSTILSFPFLGLPVAIVLLGGLGVIGLGSYFIANPLGTGNLLLSWLGVGALAGQSLDFFPLLPWFGVVLLGIVLGKVLYPKGEREFNLPDFSEGKFMEALEWIGQKALPIFMLQEPFYFLGAAQWI